MAEGFLLASSRGSGVGGLPFRWWRFLRRAWPEVAVVRGVEGPWAPSSAVAAGGKLEESTPGKAPPPTFASLPLSAPVPPKEAELRPEIRLAPHQERLRQEAQEKQPLRKLLFWQLGTGKTLGSLAALDQLGGPALAIVPASTRSSFIQEVQKAFGEVPSDLLILSPEKAQKLPDLPKDIRTVLIDEAHRLRNESSPRTRKLLQLGQKAENLLLLSGSPIVNRPGDLAPLVSLLTGKKWDAHKFEQYFLGREPYYGSWWRKLLNLPKEQRFQVRNREMLRKLLEGHVDAYQLEAPLAPIKERIVRVDMLPMQAHLHRAFLDRLPAILRKKLQEHVPLSEKDLKVLQSFLTGARQSTLSSYPWLSPPDAHKAFVTSPKLRKAFENLQNFLKERKANAIIYSNFVQAGLIPYAEALRQADIPFVMIHGSLNDKRRQDLLQDFNEGRARVALLGPAGSEGLSLRGAGLVQILDPHWQPVRTYQAIGRALRLGSHSHLPPEERNVIIEHYLAQLPKNEASSDELLFQLAKRKDQMNEPFLKLLYELGPHNS
jgi:hypothetical protein